MSLGGLPTPCQMLPPFFTLQHPPAISAVHLFAEVKIKDTEL